MQVSDRPLLESRDLGGLGLQQVVGQVDVFGLAQERIDGLDLLVEAGHQSPAVGTDGSVLLHLRLAEGAAKCPCGWNKKSC